MSLTESPKDEQIAATIYVKDHPFTEQRVILVFGPDSKTASEKCYEAAAKEGWTPPKWWQFWRHRDSLAPRVCFHSGSSLEALLESNNDSHPK